MIFQFRYHLFPQNLGLRSSRLVYALQAPPEISAAPDHVQETLDDVKRPTERRASYTRSFLDDNRLDYGDVGIHVDDPTNNQALVTAVLNLQATLGFSLEDQDGMFGQKTLAAVQEQFARIKTKIDLRSLRGKIEAVRREEGALVEHNNISTEITKTYGITASVIKAAEQECHTNAEVNQIIERNSFVSLVDYAARATQVPPSAIVGIVYAESGGSYSPNDYGPVDELGMGQFVKKYWKKYTHHQVFQQEMSKFTDRDPASIGRARSIVGDLLAIGIKLKESEKVVGPFDYNSTLNAEQLFRMRFYYHAPGYAYAYYVKNRHGDNYAVRAQAAFNRYGSRYRDRFVNKVLQIDRDLRSRIGRLYQ